VRLAEIITDERPAPLWRRLRQTGVDDVVIALPRRTTDWRGNTGDHPWDYTPLKLFTNALAAEGLRAGAVEDNPPMEAIRYGRPGRDEEIEAICTLIRNLGRLNIPVWVYGWSPSIGWVRTFAKAVGRGGARVGGYDHDQLDHSATSIHGPIHADDLWENLRYFLDRVLPVAEEAGVRIAMHPDDPPVPNVRGMDRIMSSIAGFERLLEMSDSESNGITFCQGNFTLMTDDLPGAIRSFGSTGRLGLVHFRDVRGTPMKFVETFHDEGTTDMLACMRAYREVGYTGMIRSDHVPLMEGDSQDVIGYSEAGQMFALGYLVGLREAALAD